MKYSISYDQVSKKCDKSKQTVPSVTCLSELIEILEDVYPDNIYFRKPKSQYVLTSKLMFIFPKVRKKSSKE